MGQKEKEKEGWNDGGSRGWKRKRRCMASSYVMNTLYLRFQGMLAHAPTGWLHPVLHRDSLCFTLLLTHPTSSYPSLSSLPRRSRSHREPSCSVRANYTCANQPASDEAGPVALSLHRGFNHSCPHSSEPGWSMELFSVVRQAVALLNYAEALTSFRPTLVQQPFSRGP